MNWTRFATAALFVGTVGLATAQPLTFAPRSATVNAGVLLIESQRTGAGTGVTYSPAPHLWSILESDSGIKPPQWTFQNPLGQSTLNATARGRWLAIPGAGPVPAVGARLGKSAAPYWEVPLATVTIETLVRFDVLSLSVNGFFSLNSVERERLRQYVDQGGILWIDLVNDLALDLDLPNLAPAPFSFAIDASITDANLLHPLMRFPNSLTLQDVRQMDFETGTVTTPISGMGALDPVLRTIGPDSRKLEAVAGNAGGRTVSVSRLGQGSIVVTSRGVTATINRGFLPTAPGVVQVNRGFHSLQPLRDPSYAAAAKFAVNVIGLGTSFPGPGAGPRKTGSTSFDLTAPLMRRFTANAGAGLGPGAPPVTFKGRVVSSAGGRITVFDANPSDDLDGNGNPDDGLADPVGSQADLLWQSNVIAGQLSAPVVAEVPDTVLGNPLRGNAAAVDQIWVADENSRLYVFDLDNPGVATVAPLPPTPIAPPSGNAPDPGGPFAPTIQDGLVFMADTRGTDNLGRLFIIDLATAQPVNSTNNWVMQGTGRIQQPGASPTVGYIPILDGSGGVDRVVYLPSRPGGGFNPRPAGVTSVWLGARGEPPTRRQLNGMASINLATRAASQPAPIFLAAAGPFAHLGVKITILRPNGDALTLTQLNQYLTGTVGQVGTGELVVGLTGANPLGLDLDGLQTATPNDDAGWRVDYTLDWGLATTGFGGVPSDNYVRTNLELPDDASNGRQIIGNAALGPNGNLVILTGAGAGTVGSTMFNIKEEGRQSMRLVSRFDLYDAIMFRINQGGGTGDDVVYGETIFDNDQLVQDLPFLDRSVVQMQFVGSPVVRGGTVFVAATGIKRLPFGPGANSETSVLMAFRADPPPVQFEIEGQDQNVQLIQPDVSLSTSKGSPNVQSVLQPGQFTLEAIPGTTRSRVVINNLATTDRGRVRDCLTTSLPVIVRRPGQSDVLVEPERIVDAAPFFGGNARGRFSPLLWYVVFNGLELATGPVVAGDTLYLGGSSVLPGLVSTGFTFPLQRNGLLFGMDASVSPNDEFLRDTPERPWMRQMSTFLRNPGGGPGDVRGANAVRWPQFRGVQSFDDLRVRILQAALPEPNVRALTAGDGVLAVYGDSNLHAFSRSDFLVVDEGRATQFDPAGNAIWTTDQTLQVGRQVPTGVSGVGVRLSVPTRMYTDGANGFWIVDSGNNRVTRVDAAGRELRTVTAFQLDPNFTPPGMTATSTLNLSRPRDVMVYSTTVAAANNPFTNARPLERWIHMLIADTGNYRVLELVDRYAVDPATGRVLDVVSYADPNGPNGVSRGLGMLLWHTPEELSGKKFGYTSIGRTFIDDGAGGRRSVVAFGFGNVEPGRATFGLDGTGQQVDRSSGFGGVVIYDGRNTRVITSFSRPGVQANSFLGEIPGNPGFYDFNLPVAPTPGGQQQFVGLNSVTMRYIDTAFGPRLAVMVADATGVYELVQPDPTGAPDSWAVHWMLPVEAYVGMRRPRTAGPYRGNTDLSNNPRGFRPMYARRMDSGEVLLVNGFVGRRFNDIPFRGEVVMVEGAIGGTGNSPGYDPTRQNFGFNSLSIKYELPPVVGIRGLVNPVFAERQ